MARPGYTAPKIERNPNDNAMDLAIKLENAARQALAEYEENKRKDEERRRKSFFYRHFG